MKTYRYEGDFRLERGGVLHGITIAYHTYGALSESRDNAVWVCHALTADSEVASWWPHTVESGKFLDPDKWHVVCANILGSCYGTTGPLSENPDTGEPYYDSFPPLTINDMVRAHALLADYLGISRIHALVGSSVGGFQAVEWACMEPERFDKLVLIATDAHATPWSIAINETQRMALEADATFGEHHRYAGMAGLAAARAIGLLTYRGHGGYNATQQNHEDTPRWKHRACSYQRHQGDKLCGRFNAYSYASILDAFDTHDVGRERGGVEKALSKVKMPVITVGISTDMVFPPQDMIRMTAMFPNAEYHEISSDFGHDGFLVEHGQLNEILNAFMGY